jgi:hypothetical protein
MVAKSANAYAQDYIDACENIKQMAPVVGCVMTGDVHAARDHMGAIKHDDFISVMRSMFYLESTIDGLLKALHAEALSRTIHLLVDVTDNLPPKDPTA